MTEPTSPAASTQIGAGLLTRAADLKRRLIVGALLAVPVMVLSMIPALQFPGWQWVCAIAATPVVTWAAWPFHRAAARAARHGSSTMDSLVSLGVLASYGWSLWALIAGGAGHIGMVMEMSFAPRNLGAHPHIYFESATMVTVFLLAGRYAEARARHRAGDALRALLTLGAKSAHRVGGDGVETTVPIDQVEVGDLLRVRPGEAIPTDGVVTAGRAAIDAALLTGESAPVNVTAGDEVTGATINTDGTLTVRATRVGSDTTLARIGELVTRAQAGKAPVQRLADRVSSVFVPVVLVISALTLVGWLVAGAGAQAASTAAVAVLVIACPCALGLATPTALLVGSGRAARLGIVIKGPQILEATEQIDTVLLDKTGTVTDAQMRVVKADLLAENALVLAGAVEGESAHPVAIAISEAPEAHDDLPALVQDFRDHAGRGVSGRVHGQRVFVGSPSWMSGMGVDLAPVAQSVESGQETGATVCVIARAEEIAEDVDPASSKDDPFSDDWDPTFAYEENGGGNAITNDGSGRTNAAANSSTNAAVDSDSQPGAGTIGEVGELGVPAVRLVDIAVGGMTCAACVRRVERKLEKLGGVSAQVNLATETAAVEVAGDVSEDDLVAAIEKAGYQAQVTGRRQASATPENRLPNADEPPAPASALPATADENGPATPEGDAPAHSSATSSAGSPAEATATDHPTPTAIGAVWVADTIKDDAPRAVSALKRLGITPVLVTGDNERAARTVARQVGIEDVHAHTLPADKRDLVERYQREGHVVAMVGDGVNDAAALAQAGVRGLGMTMGSGADAAIEAGDITLMGTRLTIVPTAITMSRATLRIIKQNLFWAFAYNVAAIPLAVAGLLNPMIAGAAMASSSVIVVSNSLRLRSWRPPNWVSPAEDD